MSNLATTPSADACSGAPTATPVLQALPGRPSDLGGLPIRRLLPRSQRRMVGPWCFLDSFGPLAFSSGKPMDVAPHPHIGLQTVSWLLEGEVLHDDSLGRQGLARPGVLNLMTAGRGIAHSEQTPPQNTGRLRGVQLWVALPDAHRDVEPAFAQYSALPAVRLEFGQATVLMGELGGARSPARAFSPLVAADLTVDDAAPLAGRARRRVMVPLQANFEHALVPLQGGWHLADEPLAREPLADEALAVETLAVETLYYLGCGRRELTLECDDTPARALLLGGAPFGETVLMWWNFVARTPEEIAAARSDWQAGLRFGEVAAHAGPRLEAPPFVARRRPHPQ